MSETKTSMLDTKQIIHIAAEAVVLLGITVYFSSQNKKLTATIEELSQRLEEQEDRMEKLKSGFEEGLKNLPFNQIAERLNSLENRLAVTNTFVNSLSSANTENPKKVKAKPKKPVKEEYTDIRPSPSDRQPTQKAIKKTVPLNEPVESQVTFNTQSDDADSTVRDIEEDDVENELSDTELEEELKEEIAELNQSDLKKE